MHRIVVALLQHARQRALRSIELIRHAKFNNYTYLGTRKVVMCLCVIHVVTLIQNYATCFLYISAGTSYSTYLV